MAVKKITIYTKASITDIAIAFATFHYWQH
jgi:hypothetical protein